MQRRRAGFTLVELLTVVVIFAVVAVVVGQLLMFNDRAYQNVDQVSESQQNLRAVVDLLERDVRHTGMMVPAVAAACGVDNKTGPDLLYLTDATAIDPQGDFQPYGGSTTGVTNLPPPSTTPVTLALSSLLIEPNPPLRAAYDTDADGTNDSDFRRLAGVIFADPLNPNRGTGCGRITAVDLGASQITVRLVAVPANGTGTLVAVPAVEYFVNGTQLFWNGIPLADGIEDFQVAYIFDQNGDNIVDGNDVFGVATDYTSQVQPAHELREIRANLVARTRLPDPEITTGRLQAKENRTPPGTTDGYRRRVATTRIRLRNSGARMSLL